MELDPEWDQMEAQYVSTKFSCDMDCAQLPELLRLENYKCRARDDGSFLQLGHHS